LSFPLRDVTRRNWAETPRKPEPETVQRRFWRYCRQAWYSWRPNYHVPFCNSFLREGARWSRQACALSIYLAVAEPLQTCESYTALKKPWHPITGVDRPGRPQFTMSSTSPSATRTARPSSSEMGIDYRAVSGLRRL